MLTDKMRVEGWSYYDDMGLYERTHEAHIDGKPWKSYACVAGNGTLIYSVSSLRKSNELCFDFGCLADAIRVANELIDATIIPSEGE